MSTPIKVIVKNPPPGPVKVIVTNPDTEVRTIEVSPTLVPGPGAPSGGTAAEILIKQSSTNYDATWETVSGDATLDTAGALTLQPAAISGKPLLTPLAGTEEVLVNDGGTLKKTTAQDIADLVTAAGITELTGDVTAGPGSGSQVATIPNDTVTYAKMQNVSAASRLLGRGDGGAGDVQELTLGTGLSMSGTTLNASAAGLTDPGVNGIVVRTALNTTTARTLTAGTNVTVSNGDGVSGNPTVNVPDASTATKGAVELATDGETTAGLAVQANDSRLHAAVTVSDTNTVDLTLTGQALTADVRTQLSITSDASGVKLDGDEASPGNGQYYGTDGAGTKGFHALPSGSGITELTGDVAAGPGSGSQAATIPNDTVTYAKMQNVSAASRLLGRGSASGAGDVQEITLGSGLTMTGTTLSATGGGGASVTISTTPPVGPAAGDLWFNSENGTLYVYYDDGDTQQWVAPDNGGGEMTTLDFVTRWCAPRLWQFSWPADGTNASNGFYSATVSGTAQTTTNGAGVVRVQTFSTPNSRARASLPNNSFTTFMLGDTNWTSVDWSRKFVLFFSFSTNETTTNSKSWFKFAPTSNNDGDITGRGVQLRLDNLTAVFGAHNGTTLDESAGTSISGGGQQYNVAIIGDGSGSFDFYLNGVLEATLTGPSTDEGQGLRLAVECYNGADSANQLVDCGPIKIASFA